MGLRKTATVITELTSYPLIWHHCSGKPHLAVGYTVERVNLRTGYLVDQDLPQWARKALHEQAIGDVYRRCVMGNPQRMQERACDFFRSLCQIKRAPAF